MSSSIKEVPLRFQVYLYTLISRFPSGISAKGFVQYFTGITGKPLSYNAYGYPGHVSMFRDLKDVMRVGDNAEYGLLLYPNTCNPFQDKFHWKADAINETKNGNDITHSTFTPTVSASTAASSQASCSTFSDADFNEDRLQFVDCPIGDKKEHTIEVIGLRQRYYVSAVSICIAMGMDPCEDDISQKLANARIVMEGAIIADLPIYEVDVKQPISLYPIKSAILILRLLGFKGDLTNLESVDRSR